MYWFKGLIVAAVIGTVTLVIIWLIVILIVTSDNKGLPVDERKPTPENPFIDLDWFWLLGSYGSGVIIGLIAAHEDDDDKDK